MGRFLGGRYALHTILLLSVLILAIINQQRDWRGSCYTSADHSWLGPDSANQNPTFHGTGQITVFQENPHYFQDAQGKPLFLIGPYTFWGPLSQLKGNSNYYRLGTDGMDLPIYWRARNPWLRVDSSDETSNGVVGKFDLTQFDEKFFADLRNFITEAEQLGIFVHVSLFNEIFVKYKPGCCGFGRHPFGNGNHINMELIGQVDRNNDLDGMGLNEFYDSDALWRRTSDPHRLAVARLQEQYVDRVLLETRDFPNVFYEIGNEISANEKWIAYWVQFIRARSSNPISVDDTHDNGFYPLTNEVFPVDTATYHTGDVFGDVIARAISPGAYRNNKVLGNDTDGIGRTINRDADQNRIGAWLTLTGGGAIWGDYFDGWALEDFPDEPRYFGYLLFFLEQTQLPFWEMAPCNRLASHGNLLARHGVEYLYYSTEGRPISLDLSAATGTLHYEWYNPRRGEFSLPSTLAGGSTQRFTSPDRHDWVLHISAYEIPERALPPAFNTANAALIFEDSFDDGDAHGWRSVRGTWEVCAGPFSKVYCHKGPREDSSFVGEPTWRDYTLQAFVSMPRGNVQLSLLARVQNDSDYYELALSKQGDEDTTHWSIIKRKGAASYEIASGSYQFVAEAIYLLRFDLEGSVLRAYVAPDFATAHTVTLLGTGTDSSYTNGYIGVRGSGGSVLLDELRVYSAPQCPTSETTC